MESAWKYTVVPARSVPANRPISQQYVAHRVDLRSEVKAQDGGSR
jgi:hypothetical protein